MCDTIHIINTNVSVKKVSQSQIVSTHSCQQFHCTRSYNDISTLSAHSNHLKNVITLYTYNNEK